MFVNCPRYGRSLRVCCEFLGSFFIQQVKIGIFRNVPRHVRDRFVGIWSVEIVVGQVRSVVGRVEIVVGRVESVVGRVESVGGQVRRVGEAWEGVGAACEARGRAGEARSPLGGVGSAGRRR